MQITTFHQSLSELKTELLVLVLDPNEKLFDLEHPSLESRLSEIQSGFEQERISREVLFELEGVGPVVVFSTLTEKAFSLWENLKTFTARALRLAAETGRRKVTVALNSPELAGRAVEGAFLGTYAFETYRREPKKRFEDFTLELMVPASEDLGGRLESARIVAEAVNLARDLSNEPANTLVPETLARRAQDIADRHGLECEIWREDELASQRCTGLLAVGAGSQHPPRMIRLARPVEGSAHHLVLVGKGVTFDSGGVSIKPAAGMEMMKGDMSGAAAVLGAMEALGKLGAPVSVTALICTAENLLDGRAQRPGDILVYPNGKSVQVENTDAEGRLILADGLIRCGALKATHVLDLATLTGACARALGPSFTGLMGNARELVNAVTRAGGNHGESYWKLPLPMEYKEMLKCSVADLNNVGGQYGGAITAGLFLQEFVPEKVAWAHLDIAGTFWREKPWKYFQEGPTGVGVRTLVELARNWPDYISG